MGRLTNEQRDELAQALLRIRKAHLAYEKALESIGVSSVIDLAAKYKVSSTTAYETFYKVFGFPFDYKFIFQLQVHRIKGASDPRLRELRRLAAKAGYKIIRDQNK